MKKSFKKYEKAGLPGGPNELKRFTQGFIVSERGQWDYPGLPTAVPTPTGKITMKGVEDDLLGIDNLGNAQYMTPGNEYQFEGDMVYEIPQAKKGGSKKYPKKYSRSLMARNILFTKNPLFKKSKSVKNKIFDPNSPYFQDGGITYVPIKNYDPNNPEHQLGYNSAFRTITYNPNSPIENINNPWWLGHELFHDKQNMDGKMSTYGSVGLRPNPYVASDEAIGAYYDRRGVEFDQAFDQIMQENPDMPEEKILNLAQERMYMNPSTIEGEARQEEQRIESILENLKKLKYKKIGGEIISFDFDDTLSTDRGLQMAQSMPNEKYIISARAEVTPDMIERARAAGISEDRIFATGSDKAKIAKIKELGINRHIDNKQSVINKLGSAGQIFKDGVELPEASYGHSIGNLIRKQNGGITKLSPEEEIEFQKFYATLPENLQTDDATYDIRGYWDSEGRPEKFNYDQPKESDGYYHAYSINQNTGEYLKSPAHETFQHAVDEDRKIGYRPITNVYGRNIATENPSIADSDAQSFLRNMIGAPSYIELELDDNQIEEYRKGGYIIEDISIPSLTRMDKGGNPIKQLQEKEKAAELSRLIASGAAGGLGNMANYITKAISESENKSKPSSNVSAARATAKPKSLAAVEKLASAPKTKPGEVNLAVRDFVQDAKEIDLKSKKDPYEEKNKIIYIDGDKMELKDPDADARYKQWVMNIEDRNKNQSYFEDFGDWINENIFGAESDIERAYKSTYNPVKPKTYYYNGRQVTGNGPWNNYGDAPVQMVYPEMFFMGPSGGAAGIAGNALKSGSKYAKNVIWPALNTALPLGEGITTATAGKITPFNIASLIFGSKSAANLANSDSESRKSLKKAYNNPTTSNILDAVGNVSYDVLGILGSPGVTNMFGAAPKAISNLGEFITTKTPLKNTYKYNPWAFKPNPEAAYRMIGDEAGLKDALESGYFRPSSQGSDIKIIHPETYYTMGVPSDTRKYFGHVWDRGYPGPYMTEVSNAAKDSRFTPLNTYFGSGKDLGDIVYTNPEKFIPTNEATIYKQHWLKGYKKIDVPKQLPGSPNSKFQSEIDWGKWNPDTPKYPELINEYNAIEESTKKAGTWMKNPDGSAFQGTPEQFIQQRSSWFKKAFGDSKLVHPDGSPWILEHGSPKKFDTFDESKFQLGDSGYSGSGIYTVPPKGSAASYTISGRRFHKGDIEPTLYKLYGLGKNPITSEELIKMGVNSPAGKEMDLFNFHRKSAPLNEQLLDYDVAIHNQNRGVARVRDLDDAWEVVFPTNKQLKSATGNVGFFDMTNPNIYKSMLPYIIPTGLGVGAAAYGANDGANYKSGGLIETNDNGIVSELSKKEIDRLVKQGYIVEDVSTPSLTKARTGMQMSGLDPAFQAKAQQVANNLGVSLEDLIGIMNHESGLNPAIPNPYTGAVGLIQFMPNTAKSLGTSIDALKNMSAIEQLDYVEKFYKPVAGKAKDIGDLYMYTFLPAAVGKPDDFVLGASGSGIKVFGINQDALYNQNKVFDADKKGYYTVGDVKRRIAKFSGRPLVGSSNQSIPGFESSITRTPGEKTVVKTTIIKDMQNDDWQPRKEEEQVDPRIEQLKTFTKIIEPSLQNINNIYAAAMQQKRFGGNTKMFQDGGMIMDLSDKEINQYRKGGWIVEEID